MDTQSVNKLTYGSGFGKLLLHVRQSGVDHILDEKLYLEFLEVIKRGTAFGTQTSPEMKVFADTLLGRISYTSQGSQLQPHQQSTSVVVDN